MLRSESPRHLHGAPMRNLAAALALTLLLAACSRSSPSAAAAVTAAADAAAPTEHVSVTGKVVERLDEAPYSYLRLETPAGPVWAAVLASSAVEKGSQISVVDGSAVRDVELRALGRKLDSVVFGTMKLPR